MQTRRAADTQAGLVRHGGARIQVVRGAVQPTLLELRPGEPRRLYVGSATTCALRVWAADAAPVELEVVWDGELLWVRDTYCLGRARVNGERLTDWTALPGNTLAHAGAVCLLLHGPATAPTRHAPALGPLLAETERDASTRATGRMTLPSEPTQPGAAMVGTDLAPPVAARRARVEAQALVWLALLASVALFVSALLLNA